MKSHFMQCSKRLIYDFCERYNIWNGPEAKWFEGCEESSEVEAAFTTWNFRESKVDQIWKGTLAPENPYACHKLPLIGKDTVTGSYSPSEEYARMAYLRVGEYFYEKYQRDGTVMPTITPSFGKLSAVM
jgi:hypothetical protein